MLNAIFEELDIKGMKLKNRIAMSPMGNNFANMDGTMSEQHFKYYEKRARGGTGLITLENVCFDYPMGTNGTTQLRIDNDQYIPSLYRFNQLMHSYGACTSVQINHAGASAYALRLNGEQAVSSSNVPSKIGGQIPRPLNTKEIYGIINKYAEAATRAVKAGFDCIEIHAGHSYLLSQFLSPIYNKRDDEFGGSIENRVRLTKLIAQEIRKAVGESFPISLRFSAEDLLEQGNTLEDTVKALTYVVDYVDILSVSSGLNNSIQYQIDQMNLPDGWRSNIAKQIKDTFPNKIVMASGNIRDPKVANEIIENKHADIITIGRGLIAEPNWVNKVKSNKISSLKKCISCNIGCADHRISKSKPIRCTINPDIINNDDYLQNKISSKVKVVVIGGGCAGLEAACSCAEIGAEVTLFERNSYLGGLGKDITHLPDKIRIHDFISYLTERASKLKNLTINLNKEADIQEIESIKPDIIVNATGSQPLIVPIKGLIENINKENKNIYTIFDLLQNVDNFKNLENKKVVIIGGGAVGLDVAEFFHGENIKDITIVEMQNQLGVDLDIVSKSYIDELIKKSGINVLLNTKLVEVLENSFIVDNGKKEEISFDLGFVCLGLKPDNNFLSKLQKYKEENNIELTNIGDSKKCRKIIDGVFEGRSIINQVYQLNNLKNERCI